MIERIVYSRTATDGKFSRAVTYHYRFSVKTLAQPMIPSIYLFSAFQKPQSDRQAVEPETLLKGP